MGQNNAFSTIRSPLTRVRSGRTAARVTAAAALKGVHLKTSNFHRSIFKLKYTNLLSHGIWTPYLIFCQTFNSDLRPGLASQPIRGSGRVCLFVRLFLMTFSTVNLFLLKKMHFISSYKTVLGWNNSFLRRSEATS